MPPSTSVCRICLAMNVRLFRINGVLQMVYERIASTTLYTADEKPVVACYVCCAQLKKCYNLMVTSCKADNVLNVILQSHRKITVETVSDFDRRTNGLAWPLAETKAECYQNLSPTIAPIKTVKTVPELIVNVGTDGSLQLAELPIVTEIKTEIKEEVDQEFVSPSQPPSSSGVDVTPNTEEVVLQPVPAANIKDTHSIQTTSDKDPLSLAREDMSKVEARDAHTSRTDQQEVKRSTTFNKQRDSQQNTVIKTVHVHQCIFCKRRFTTDEDLQTHLKSHAGEKYYTCKVCSKPFKRNDIFIRHIRTHKREKPHECVICGKPFTRAEHLNQHISTHDLQQPYACKICKEQIKGEVEIMKHVTCHSAETHFDCNECQRRFNQKCSLIRHFKTHTDDKAQCNICQKFFKYSANLSRHIRTQHSQKSTRKM